MVRFLKPPAGGTGRDGYIHMRDEFRVGKFYMPRDVDGTAAKRGGTRSLDLMESSTRRAQKSTCDRLSSPSLRQLRVARQRAEEQDRMCMGQLRLSMPYCPGQSLDQRSRQIKEVLREDWVHLGSPLPRSPISPQLLSATGRWGVSSRGSMARPHTSSPYLGA